MFHNLKSSFLSSYRPVHVVLSHCRGKEIRWWLLGPEVAFKVLLCFAPVSDLYLCKHQNQTYCSSGLSALSSPLDTLHISYKLLINNLHFGIWMTQKHCFKESMILHCQRKKILLFKSLHLQCCQRKIYFKGKFIPPLLNVKQSPSLAAVFSSHESC